ncbi:MAG: hypothetical protein KIS94_05100 [Chitinophagales bacterium]|nr:hypothetical protein [Chitinophagales bacterium]
MRYDYRQRFSALRSGAKSIKCIEECKFEQLWHTRLNGKGGQADDADFYD